MRWTVTLALCALVSGCATTGHECAGWRMIEGEARDVDAISDTLAVSVARHNEFGRELGCW